MVAFALIFTVARLFSYGTRQLSDNLFIYSIDEGLPGSGPKSCLLPNEMLASKSLIQSPMRSINQLIIVI